MKKKYGVRHHCARCLKVRFFEVTFERTPDSNGKPGIVRVRVRCECCSKMIFWRIPCSEWEKMKREYQKTQVRKSKKRGICHES